MPGGHRSDTDRDDGHGAARGNDRKVSPVKEIKMIPELVKQAVQIKMTCKSECPLISEAEYCHACARALKELNAPDDLVQELHQASSVEEARGELTPYFRKRREEYAGQPALYRLFNLLIHCRVEGEITDEIRKLMDI